VKGNQWFSFWMTILTVTGGGATTLAAVWIGASLALKGHRKAGQDERGRAACERCFAAINDLLRMYHRITFAMKVELRDRPGESPKILDWLFDVWERLEATDVGYQALLLPRWEMTETVLNCLVEPNGFWQWDGSPEELLVSMDSYVEQLRSVWRMLRNELVTEISEG